MDEGSGAPGARVDVPEPLGSHASRLARRVLFAFALTFVASRVTVFLIMSRRIPLLYLQLRGVHVHHLNYGIGLMTLTCAYLLFGEPGRAGQRRAALVFGVALGLTFDEFGMWLHLGGSYWQRASVDAVAVVACFLALTALAPALEHRRPRHWWAFAAMVLAVGVFAWAVVIAGNELGRIAGPRLRELELASTP